jgi:hypothetical protein
VSVGSHYKEECGTQKYIPLNLPLILPHLIFTQNVASPYTVLLPARDSSAISRDGHVQVALLCIDNGGKGAGAIVGR